MRCAEAVENARNGRLQLLDQAFLYGDFTGGMLSSDQAVGMAAAASFWGDQLPSELPDVPPPPTPVVIEELERADSLGEVPLPYLWQALQTVRGVRTPGEKVGDRGAAVVRVANFVPELALIGVTGAVGMVSPKLAHVIDVATAPVTHADEVAKWLSRRSRQQLGIELHRLIRESYSEDQYAAKDQAPWLVVHIMRRVANFRDSELSARAGPILARVLADTFDRSSKRSVFRIPPSYLEEKVAKLHTEKEKTAAREANTLLSIHPMDDLLNVLHALSLENAMQRFGMIRRRQRDAYEQKRLEQLLKGRNQEHVRPTQAVDGRRYTSDCDYGHLVHATGELVKIFNAYLQAEDLDEATLTSLAQSLAALSELSGLPVANYRKFGLDYDDPEVQAFLRDSGDRMAAKLGMSSLGMARLLADAVSPDPDVRKRSPFYYVDSSTRIGLLIDLRTDAYMHFGMNPQQYRGKRELRGAIVEAYIYSRTRRGDPDIAGEAAELVRSRRAGRFLRAITDVPGIPVLQLHHDIIHAKANYAPLRTARASRMVRGLLKNPFPEDWQ